jgi:hypothetical protein
MLLQREGPDLARSCRSRLCTSRQILRVEQTCHGRRGTAESETQTGHAQRRIGALPRPTSGASNTPDRHAAMWYALTSHS